MKAYKKSLLISFLLLNFFFIKSQAQENSVHIGGEVTKAYDLTPQIFSSLNQLQVKINGKDSVQHNYAGVSLYELLSRSGAIAGGQLKGKELTKYILITAADGYKVVLALAEVDPGFTDHPVLLVNKDNGEPLAANYGPYRLIVPGDKRPARSVMRVVSIEVCSALVK